MPKRDIHMGTKEIDDFLSRCEVMVVGTVDADGWPTATLAHCEFRNGALLLGLDPTDSVAASAVTCGQLCCVADEHASYYEIRGVIVHGERTSWTKAFASRSSDARVSTSENSGVRRTRRERPA
jgi:nitroimidazol reductase NimA-like FMN-containing flavoprotein (pyridoxamine 5'-phosphate oxidase superfamily)